MPAVDRRVKLKHTQCIARGTCQKYCGLCLLERKQHRVIIRGVSLFGACIDWGYCICGLCMQLNRGKRCKKPDIAAVIDTARAIVEPPKRVIDL